MSFLCEVCGNPSGLGVSPRVTTVSVRQRQYQNGGSLSSGYEIESEMKQCPECAGETIGELVEPDLSPFIASGRTMQLHARGCKKPLDDCKICQYNIKKFASFPPQALSLVCEDDGLLLGKKANG